MSLENEPLKIPLREQAVAHEYIKTHGYQTKIFLRPQIDFRAYQAGDQKPLDKVESQQLDLDKIAIQLSESVQELLVLFSDVHRHVADALGHLSVPGPGNEEHMKYKINLTGEALMRIMRRYEDFKYKRGV